MTLDQQRKKNTLEVMRENAIGMEELAYCLGKEPENLQKIIEADQSRFNDALARQIEQTFSKPKFWLDQGEGLTGNQNFDLFG